MEGMASEDGFPFIPKLPSEAKVEDYLWGGGGGLEMLDYSSAAYPLNGCPF